MPFHSIVAVILYHFIYPDESYDKFFGNTYFYDCEKDEILRKYYKEHIPQDSQTRGFCYLAAEEPLIDFHKQNRTPNSRCPNSRCPNISSPKFVSLKGLL